MGATSSVSRAVVTGLVAVCVALSGVAPTSVRADAGDFDYAVARVTVDGNLWGPHDGTPDAVEETFDPHVNPVNGVPGPPFGFTIPFNSLLGTVSPVDGALHLMSPGAQIVLESLGLSFIMSDVVSAPPMLRDGAGDARVEVAFQAATLGVNHFVHATFSIGNVWAGLAFANFDAVVAQRQLGPAIPGFSMWAHLLDNGLVPIGGQSLPVDPAAVGGPFVLALDYDDTSKTLTPSFSLDGGATFTGGFDPLPITGFDGSGVATGVLIIGADPRTPFQSATCPYGFSHHSVRVGHVRTGNVVSFSARGLFDSRVVLFDPVSEGAQLVITDHGVASDIVHVTVPPGAPGSGCDPRDGWTAKSGSAFMYRNYSNAFPPACAPGSATGLVRLKVGLANLYRVRIAALVNVPTAPASIAGPVSSLFVRGNGANTDAAGACLAVESGVTPCTVGPRRARCRY